MVQAPERWGGGLPFRKTVRRDLVDFEPKSIDAGREMVRETEICDVKNVGFSLIPAAQGKIA